MPKRGPALYELISERPPARPPAGTDSDADADTHAQPTPDRAPGRAARGAEPKPATQYTQVRRPPLRSQSESDEPESPLSAMLAPGRVIRVPVGYIWFAVAAFIGVSVAAYAIGHRAATAQHEAEARDFAQRGTPDLGPTDGDGARDQVPFDPLAERRAQVADAPATQRDEDPGGQVSRRESAPPADPVDIDSRSVTGSDLPNVYFVGGNVGDPRVSGRNYLVLAASIAQEEAERVALFFGGRGLPIVRTTPDRSGRCAVTTLEGVTREQLRGNDAFKQRLESEVARIGRLFQLQGGFTAFEDAYWARID